MSAPETSTEKSTRTRAEIHRENAQHSTGPKTEEGKAKSSQNGFTHGVYSKQVVVPGGASTGRGFAPPNERGASADLGRAHSLFGASCAISREGESVVRASSPKDPAELDELRAKLRDEHQPASTTTEILVDELAQNYWRMRRIRCQEVGPWRQGLEGPPDYPKIEFFARAANSAERSFHKTLTALQKLQKDRGFVPQKTVPSQPAAAVAALAPAAEAAIQQVLECLFPPDQPKKKQNSGFVPQILANPNIKAARKRLAANKSA